MITIIAQIVGLALMIVSLFLVAYQMGRNRGYEDAINDADEHITEGLRKKGYDDERSH